MRLPVICLGRERGGWVGGRAECPSRRVEGSCSGPCVARHSTLLQHVTLLDRAQDKDRDLACTVVALGSMDRKFTVWNMNEGRPVFLGDGFFDRTIMDMCWTPSGRHLVVASFDGTLAVLRFDSAELGAHAGRAVLCRARAPPLSLVNRTLGGAWCARCARAVLFSHVLRSVLGVNRNEPRGRESPVSALPRGVCVWRASQPPNSCVRSAAAVSGVCVPTVRPSQATR